MPMMVANLQEYLDIAKARVGIGYRLTDRCGKTIAEYNNDTKEIEFDLGCALTLRIAKGESFGSESIQAFLDHVFRHELHHSRGLDETGATQADIDYFRWEPHRSEDRLRECVMAINVLQNETIDIEVDFLYLKRWHVLLPDLLAYTFAKRAEGGPDGELMFRIIGRFMHNLGYGRH